MPSVFVMLDDEGKKAYEGSSEEESEDEQQDNDPSQSRLNSL